MSTDIEENEQPKTLNEILSAKYDEIQTRETDTAETKEPVKVSSEEKQPESKKDTKEVAQAEKEKENEGAEDATKEIKADDGKGGEVFSKPPASWSAKSKALWNSLPLDVRAEAYKQEKDVQKMLGKHASELKKYEAYEKVISPRRDKLAAMYGGDDKALEQLFALSDFAEKDPMGFVQYFSQLRGLNLSQPNNTQQKQDPNLAAIYKELDALKGYVNQSQMSQKQEEALRKQALEAEIDRQFNEFSSDPQNIHLEDVRDDMAALLQSGAASDFKDAYEKAIWTNPIVREKMMADRAKVENEKRQKEAEEKAKAAKRIQATNVATRGVTGASPEKPKSIRDTMSSVYDSMQGVA